MEINEIYNTDCIEGMKQIPSGSIDLILCDLPYGITARNKWDNVIDPAGLWEQYTRIIKDNGAIVLFGSGMFTANMMKTGEKIHRYNIIWQKTTPTGFLNAKKAPLRSHEDIMVFYKKQPTYNPQKTHGHDPVHSYTKKTPDGNNYGSTKLGISGGGNTDRYPTSVIRFKTDKQKAAIHPTQKPIELLRWIIRTYTNPGDVVLDNACGSGSTCLAASIEKRRYIGMDNGACDDPKSKYFGRSWADISKERVRKEKNQ